MICHLWLLRIRAKTLVPAKWHPSPTSREITAVPGHVTTLMQARILLSIYPSCSYQLLRYHRINHLLINTLICSPVHICVLLLTF